MMPPSYCLGFAFDLTQRDAQIIGNANVALIQKIKPQWQFGSLNGIGGLIESFDHGEGASRAGLTAMVREFYEETGYQTEIPDWEHYHTMGNEGWQVECFRAFNIPIPQLKTTTEEKVRVVSAYDLPENVLFNLRWLIPLALDPQPLPTYQVYR